jgi:hypothetical protein
MRSRRMQLRQEAMDDPDMSDEGDDEEPIQDDESEVFEGPCCEICLDDRHTDQTRCRSQRHDCSFIDSIAEG